LSTSELDDDEVLEAARATVLDFGVRRTTVSEVARRAGLSRMTVYRRYPDGAALMRALMTREFGALVEQARLESLEHPAGRRRVVAAAANTVALLQTHPLMLRLLELEPELLLPYLTERLGRFQSIARAALAAAIAEAQRQPSGAVRAGAPEELAAAVELSGRGLVIAARALTPQERATALEQWRLMIDAYLATV
jgi:AcrR family transcriptional regulator